MRPTSQFFAIVRMWAALLAATLFFSANAASTSANKAQTNANFPVPPISVDASHFDFGTVKQGDLVTHTFTISNRSNSPLKVEDIKIGTQGLTIKTNSVIPADTLSPATLTLDTRRFRQQTKAQLKINFNDAKVPPLVFTLEGVVLPPIDILPLPAAYLSRYVGEKSVRTLTIRNNQQTELVITQLEPKGKHFAADLETVKHGKLYKLHITAPEGTEPGRYREALVLHTNDPNQPRIHLEMNILVKDEVYVTQDEVDFGAISTQQVQHNPGILKLIQQTLLIKRKTGEMTLTSITSDIPFLTIGQEPEGQAKNFHLDVGLLPDKLLPGKFAGTVKIKTDDPKHPEISIPINGEIIK
jgi:hypothetical protein